MLPWLVGPCGRLSPVPCGGPVCGPVSIVVRRSGAGVAGGFLGGRRACLVSAFLWDVALVFEAVIPAIHALILRLPVAKGGEQGFLQRPPKQFVVGLVAVHKHRRAWCPSQKLLHYLVGQHGELRAQDADPLAWGAGQGAVQEFTHRLLVPAGGGAARVGKRRAGQLRPRYDPRQPQPGWRSPLPAYCGPVLQVLPADLLRSRCRDAAGGWRPADDRDRCWRRIFRIVRCSERRAESCHLPINL